MIKLKCIVLVLGIMFLPIFSQEAVDETAVEYVEEQADGSSMNWANKVLRVTGNGFGPERIKSLGRRKVLAKRAARLDALRNILEAVKGVQVTSKTTVEDMMLESDQIQAGAQGLVKGMRVVKISYTDDGGCEMVAEVSLGREGSFILAALNDSTIGVEDDYPKFDWIAFKAEFEKTETELAAARAGLDQKARELRGIKAKYAALKNNFDRDGKELAAANQNIVRAEERLKSSNLKKDELKGTLDTTQKELTKTRDIIDNLSRTINSSKIANAAKDKELALTKNYLSEKKTELARLSGELQQYCEKVGDAVVDSAKLAGYIKQIKDTQEQTKQRMDAFYASAARTGDAAPGKQAVLETAANKEMETGEKAGTDTPKEPGMEISKEVNITYTGLLIDARALGLKPVLAPAILNEQEKKLYGVGVIPKDVKGGAIVDYLSGTVDRVKKYKKVGPSPLLIKGIKSVNKSDIMISNEDTKKLVPIMELLEKQKVAVLI